MPLVRIFTDQSGTVAFAKLIRFNTQARPWIEIRAVVLTKAGKRAYANIFRMLVGHEFHIASPDDGPIFVGCRADNFAEPNTSVIFLARDAVNADGTSVVFD